MPALSPLAPVHSSVWATSPPPTFIVGIISILVTVALACRNVPGSLLIGIVVAVIAGIPLGVTQAPTGIIAPLDFSSIGGPIADAGGVPAIVKVLTDPALLVISVLAAHE